MLVRAKKSFASEIVSCTMSLIRNNSFIIRDVLGWALFLYKQSFGGFVKNV
jgi:hypothetical protein